MRPYPGGTTPPPNRKRKMRSLFIQVLRVWKLASDGNKIVETRFGVPGQLNKG